MLKYVPNILSFSRIPLALAFLSENPKIRVAAVLLAMLTDFLDGYIARRTSHTSQLGTILDPIGDKFFVIFAFIILISESKLTPFHAFEMLSRDWAIVLFGFYLLTRGEWASYKIKAFWCGKITTVFQFIVLMALTMNVVVPDPMYAIFVMLGLFSLPELYYLNQQKVEELKGQRE